MKKKLAILLVIAILSVSCLVLLTACNSAEKDALQLYIFNKDGRLVDEDFVLPGKIGEFDAVWASDNDAVKVAQNSDGDFTATVTRPADGEVTAKLTITVNGKVSKDFSVRVAAIGVDEIAENFKMAKAKATVREDFELEATTTYAGKTANITWTVGDEASKAYIAVDGYTCKILKRDDDNVEVKITANITYGTGSDNTITKPFKFTVKGLNLLVYDATPVKDMTAIAEDTAYCLAMDLKGVTYFSTGEVYNSYYTGISKDGTEMVPVYIKKVEGGFNLYFKKTATSEPVYLEAVVSGTHVNALPGAEVTTHTVWTWDASAKVIKTAITGDASVAGDYFLGTYSGSQGTPYVDIACNKLTNGKVGDTQFAAFLGTFGSHFEKEYLPEHKGTQADPYSVKDMLGVGEAITTGTSEQVWVKGYVSAINTTESATTSEFISFYIVDASGAPNSERGYLFKVRYTADIKAITVGDEIVATGWLQKYNGSVQLSYKGSDNPSLVSRKAYTLPTVETTHAGTEADPYDVADAIKHGSALFSGVKTAQVYVKGYISTVGTANASGQVTNAYLVASLDDIGNNDAVALQLYRCYLTNNVKSLAVGDEVVICGYITLYGKTVEIHDGPTSSDHSEYVSRVSVNGKGSVAIDTESSEKATVVKADGSAWADIADTDNHTEVTFKVNVEEGFKVAAVKANGVVIVAKDGVYTTEVNGEVKILVTTEEANTDSETIVIETFAAGKGWTNSQKQASPIALSEKLTLSYTAKEGASNTGKYYTGDQSIRFYSSEQAKVTFTAAEGKTIESIKLVFSKGAGYVGESESATITSNTAIEVNANSVTITVTSILQLQSIVVVYGE